MTTDLQGNNLLAKTESKIRFSEVDSLRVVWHGHYLQYFELGREAFGEQYGLSYQSIYNNGYVTPLVKTLLEHKAPLSYGDTAIIETEYLDTKAAKIQFNYKIYSKNTGKLATTGQTTQVFVKIDGGLDIIMPPFFELWKKQWNLL